MWIWDILRCAPACALPHTQRTLLVAVRAYLALFSYPARTPPCHAYAHRPPAHFAARVTPLCVCTHAHAHALRERKEEVMCPDNVCVCVCVCVCMRAAAARTRTHTRACAPCLPRPACRPRACSALRELQEEKRGNRTTWWGGGDGYGWNGRWFGHSVTPIIWTFSLHLSGLYACAWFFMPRGCTAPARRAVPLPYLARAQRRFWTVLRVSPYDVASRCAGRSRCVGLLAFTVKPRGLRAALRTAWFLAARTITARRSAAPYTYALPTATTAPRYRLLCRVPHHRYTRVVDERQNGLVLLHAGERAMGARRTQVCGRATPLPWFRNVYTFFSAYLRSAACLVTRLLLRTAQRARAMLNNANAPLIAPAPHVCLHLSL